MPRERRDSDGRGSLHQNYRERHESRGPVEPAGYNSTSSRLDKHKLRSDPDEQLSQDYGGYTGQVTSQNYPYTSNDSSRIRRPPASGYEANANYAIDEARARFVQIDFHDYEACSDFVSDHPEVLDDDEAYVQQAIIEYGRKHDDLAQQCLHRALLAGFAKQFREKDRATYIYDIPANKQYKKEFMREYKKLEDTTFGQVDSSASIAAGSNAGVDSRQRRPSMHQSSSASAVANWSEDRNLPAIGEMNIHDQQGYIPAQAGGEGEYPPPESSRHRRSFGRQESSYPNRTRIPSLVSNKSTLQPGFKVKPPEFFNFGRVCKVLWHSPAGNDIRGNMNKANCHIGMYNEPVYSSIRWMLVIMQKSGHCICCPISTYSGQGLGSKNFTEQDLQAHAMIYAEGGQPTRFTDEPEMSKYAIPVIPSGKKSDIHPASRVHFGKVHTLEYNWKVMDVGQVNPKFYSAIQGYIQQELGINLA